MYEKVNNYENLIKAGKECEENVRWKSSVQIFEVNTLRRIGCKKKELENRNVINKNPHRFKIVERGKKRDICAIDIDQRCVQKCFCRQIVIPETEKTLIRDNYATIKERGTEDAIERVIKNLHHMFRKYGTGFWVATFDCHNYFGSIDQTRLKSIASDYFEDIDTINLFNQGIDRNRSGIELGAEQNQIAAVFYLNKIDHMIKEQTLVKFYGRYNDDIILMAKDKETLLEAGDIIKKSLEEMGMELNEKKTSLCCASKSGFSFLKKRFKVTETGKVIVRLEHSKIAGERKKLKKLKKNGVSIEAAEKSYQSWRSYAIKYNMYNTIKNMDELFFQLYGRRIKDDRK